MHTAPYSSLRIVLFTDLSFLYVSQRRDYYNSFSLPKNLIMKDFQMGPTYMLMLSQGAYSPLLTFDKSSGND